MADFLSRLDEPLPKKEVQDYLDKIPYPGIKAVLDNTINPLEEWAELGVRPNPEGVNADEWSHNLDRSFRNNYIIPSFPTREQHARSVQNARSRFNKLNQSYSC